MRGVIVMFLAVALATHVALATEGARATDADGFLLERDTVVLAPRPGLHITAVDVDNRLGDVRIVGEDRAGAELAIMKRAPDGLSLERLQVRLVPDPAGTLRVRSVLLVGGEERPIPAHAVRVDLVLRLPRDAAVAVSAWNGKVAVSGVRRGARLAANDADITVEDVAGVVSISNTRGRQRLTSIAGAVSADNVYGEVALDQISGDSLAASVHDGSVVATRIRSEVVRIRTTFGRIVFAGELLRGGRYDIRSVTGNVRVRFGADASARIDAYARSGALDSQLDLADAARPEVGRLLGSYGPARARPAFLEVSSSVGSVSLGLLTD